MNDKILKFNEDNIAFLDDLCSPLVHLDINYFSYIRVYDNKKGIRIGNNLKFNEFMLRHKVVCTYQDIVDNLVDQTSYISFSAPTKEISWAIDYCKINFALMIMLRKDNFVEGIGIYSTNKKDIFLNYNDMIPIFYRFKTYFNIKSKDIIEKALNNDVFFDTTLNISTNYKEIQYYN